MAKKTYRKPFAGPQSKRAKMKSPQPKVKSVAEMAAIKKANKRKEIEEKEKARKAKAEKKNKERLAKIAKKSKEKKDKIEKKSQMKKYDLENKSKARKEKEKLRMWSGSVYYLR